MSDTLKDNVHTGATSACCDKTSCCGGAHQAADTLLDLRVRDAQRSGQKLTEEDKRRFRDEIQARYQSQTDIRYGAARGWVDAIIPPTETRRWLLEALRLIPNRVYPAEFRTGVFQV